jgi:hypothetical protein
MAFVRDEYDGVLMVEATLLTTCAGHLETAGSIARQGFKGNGFFTPIKPAVGA